MQNQNFQLTVAQTDAVLVHWNGKIMLAKYWCTNDSFIQV